MHQNKRICLEKSDCNSIEVDQGAMLSQIPVLDAVVPHLNFKEMIQLSNVSKDWLDIFREDRACIWKTWVDSKPCLTNMPLYPANYINRDFRFKDQTLDSWFRRLICYSAEISLATLDCFLKLQSYAYLIGSAERQDVILDHLFFAKPRDNPLRYDTYYGMNGEHFTATVPVAYALARKQVSMINTIQYLLNCYEVVIDKKHDDRQRCEAVIAALLPLLKPQQFIDNLWDKLDNPYIKDSAEILWSAASWRVEIVVDYVMPLLPRAIDLLFSHGLHFENCKKKVVVLIERLVECGHPRGRLLTCRWKKGDKYKPEEIKQKLYDYGVMNTIAKYNIKLKL